MNHIKVLFFATLRDYTGSRDLDLEIPFGTTIKELTERLLSEYPVLGKVKESMIVAVNHAYIADDTVIPDNAEIAYFPPVSGG